MISLKTNQKALTMEVFVVTGGDYNEEDNVLCINDENQESMYQAYFIENGINYAERIE